MLSYQVRANYRHHQAHVYVVTPQAVREDKYAAASRAGRDYESLARQAEAEPELVILFDDSYKGDDLRKLVDFAESLGIPVKFICLLDYANSRGAVDMGVTPELLPGYEPSGQPGMHVGEMIGAGTERAVGGGRQSAQGRARAQGGFPGGAGHVPHRDGAAGRCGPAGGFGLRKERHGHQHLGRSAAPHARHQHHGRQDRPGNHGLPGARNGRGGGARPLDAGNRFRGNSPDGAAVTIFPCR
jgi:hypothetical protein